MKAIRSLLGMMSALAVFSCDESDDRDAQDPSTSSAALFATLEAEHGVIHNHPFVAREGDRVVYMEPGAVCWQHELLGPTKAVVYYGNPEYGAEEMVLTLDGKTAATVALPQAASWHLPTATATGYFDGSGRSTICLEAREEQSGGWIASIDRVELYDNSRQPESPDTPKGVDPGGPGPRLPEEPTDDEDPPATGDPGACSQTRGIATAGYDICVDGQEFVVKGVNYDPQHEESCGQIVFYEAPAYNDLWEEQDAAKIAGMNANTIRTYSALSKVITNDADACPYGTPCWLSDDHLDLLDSYGLKIILAVSAEANLEAGEHRELAARYKDHPAVLAMMLGNEMNYNSLYRQDGTSSSALIDETNPYFDEARAAGWTKPMILGWGQPAASDRDPLRRTRADIVAYQIYNQLSFTIETGQSVFDWHRGTFDGISAPKVPGLITEYGADARNENLQREDESSQAHAADQLTNQIREDALRADGIAGGLLFTWSDNWGKMDEAGTHDCQQDTLGLTNLQGTGPYPDSIFHEEWWGVVRRDRSARMVYDTLRRLFSTY